MDRLHPALLGSAYNKGLPTTVPAHFSEVAGAWPLTREGRTFPVLRSAEALDELREELRREIESKFAIALEELPDEFPPPPLEPIPGIRPLTSNPLRELPAPWRSAWYSLPVANLPPEVEWVFGDMPF